MEQQILLPDSPARFLAESVTLSPRDGRAGRRFSHSSHPLRRASECATGNYPTGFFALPIIAPGSRYPIGFPAADAGRPAGRADGRKKEGYWQPACPTGEHTHARSHAQTERRTDGRADPPTIRRADMRSARQLPDELARAHRRARNVRKLFCVQTCSRSED